MNKTQQLIIVFIYISFIAGEAKYLWQYANCMSSLTNFVLNCWLMLYTDYFTHGILKLY